MPLKQTLANLLQTKITQATVHVAEVAPHGKLFAVVVSDSFAGAADDARQQRVWQILRAALNHEELLRIDFLQLVTRAEQTHAVRWVDAPGQSQHHDEGISESELAALSLTEAPIGWTRADLRTLPTRATPARKGDRRHG